MADSDDKGPTVLSRDGEQGAFEDLIREHQRMVYSLCYRMTGSAAEAEDLAQETFIQAYQHLESFRAEARLSSWLYRIAVNRCLNWRQRQQRQERLHRDWGEQESRPAGDESERAGQVQAALMTLHPKQRAAVVLTTYDGLTHAEAARALGCSETTISWRLFAARRKLKRLLRGLAGSGGNP
jgi:RNA polymerase sigma-70 factor (ECF subfamily)